MTATNISNFGSFRCSPPVLEQDMEHIFTGKKQKLNYTTFITTIKVMNNNIYKVFMYTSANHSISSSEEYKISINQSP